MNTNPLVYLNFTVMVSASAYGEYTARITSSSVGETITGTPIPDPLQITALRSKLAAHPSEGGIRKLGTLLFETLLPGDLAVLFREALHNAAAINACLRINLHLEPNELSALPWELLFDPVETQFLALSRRITLVRYLPSPDLPQYPLTTSYPLRILALFPNPVDSPPIDIERERQVMNEALAPLTTRGIVDLITLEHATIWDLVETLREQQVHILYYQGHIGFHRAGSSYLLLEDSAGEIYMKEIGPLSSTMRRSNVRLAVINSREMSGGTIAYDLVRRGIPAAVATQEPIGDGEILSFLRRFSQALADGLPIDTAITEGRRAIFLNEGPNGRWASPILVIRQPDAALFSLEARP